MTCSFLATLLCVSAVGVPRCHAHSVPVPEARNLLQVKAVARAAQPTEGASAAEPSSAEAGNGVSIGQAHAANGTAGTGSASDGPVANGSAKLAGKRKHSESIAAAVISEPANGAVAPSEQLHADKPRKKSKARASGANDAVVALSVPATYALANAVPGSNIEPGQRRKQTREPIAGAASKPAAEESGKQPRKKSRKISESEEQPRDSSATLKQEQLHGAADDTQQSIAERTGALQRMTAAGLTPPKSELRKLRKAKKAVQVYPFTRLGSACPGSTLAS